MTDKATEKELNRLRRLPENMVCPNCGRVDKLFGFSAVCWQFKAFVCGECKSAHQSFSHRVKSVTMSNWKMDEVLQLDEKNGGGNRIAFQKWIAGSPESARPNDKSSQDVLKRFIDRAYNNKAWEQEYHGSGSRKDEDFHRGSAAGPQNHVIGGNRLDSPDSTPQNARGGARIAAPPTSASARAIAPAPAPAPAQVANLLDDMFDAPPAASAPPAARPAPVAVAPQQPSFDPFGLPAPAPTAVPAAASMFDPAGPIAAAAPAAPAPAPFDPFALPAEQRQLQQVPQMQQPQPMQPMQLQGALGASQGGMLSQFGQQQFQQQPQQGMSAFPFASGGMGSIAQPQQQAGAMPQQQQQQQPQLGMGAGAGGSAPSMGGACGGSAFGFMGYTGAQAGAGMPQGPCGMQSGPCGMQPGPAAPWPQGQCMQAPQQPQQQAFDPFHMPGAGPSMGAAAQPQQMFQQGSAGMTAQQPSAFASFAAGSAGGYAPGPMQQQPQQQQWSSQVQGGNFNTFGQMPMQHQPPQQPQQPQQVPGGFPLASASTGAAASPQQGADMFDPFAPAAPTRPMAVHA